MIKLIMAIPIMIWMVHFSIKISQAPICRFFIPNTNKLRKQLFKLPKLSQPYHCTYVEH